MRGHSQKCSRKYLQDIHYWAEVFAGVPLVGKGFQRKTSNQTEILALYTRDISKTLDFFKVLVENGRIIEEGDGEINDTQRK